MYPGQSHEHIPLDISTGTDLPRGGFRRPHLRQLGAASQAFVHDSVTLMARPR